MRKGGEREALWGDHRVSEEGIRGQTVTNIQHENFMIRSADGSSYLGKKIVECVLSSSKSAGHDSCPLFAISRLHKQDVREKLHSVLLSDTDTFQFILTCESKVQDKVGRSHRLISVL